MLLDSSFNGVSKRLLLNPGDEKKRENTNMDLLISKFIQFRPAISMSFETVFHREEETSKVCIKAPKINSETLR